MVNRNIYIYIYLWRLECGMYDENDRTFHIINRYISISLSRLRDINIYPLIEEAIASGREKFLRRRRGT